MGLPATVTAVQYSRGISYTTARRTARGRGLSCCSRCEPGLVSRCKELGRRPRPTLVVPVLEQFQSQGLKAQEPSFPHEHVLEHAMNEFESSVTHVNMYVTRNPCICPCMKANFSLVV